MTPQEIVHLNREGTRLQQSGNFRQALAEFRTACDGMRGWEPLADEPDACAFCDLLTNVVGAAERLGEYDVALDSYREAVEALARFAVSDSFPVSLRLTECWCGIASIHRRLDARRSAEQALAAAAEIIEKPWGGQHVPELSLWRSRISLIRANMATESLHFGEAIPLFEEAMNNIRPCIGHGSEYRSEAGHIAYSRGVAEALERKWREAESNFRKSYRLFSPLVSSMPHVYGPRMIDVCSHLTYVLQSRGKDLQSARMLTVARRFQAETGLYDLDPLPPEAAVSIATLDYFDGMSHERAGRLGDAESRFHSGLARIEPIRGRSPLPQLVGAQCCERLAYLAVERGRTDEAIHWGQEATRWLDAGGSGDPAEAFDRGRVLVLLGASSLAVEDWPRAVDFLSQGLEVLKGHSSTAGDADIVAALINRSAACARLGYADQAVKDASVALQLIEVTNGLPPTLQTGALLARADAYEALGLSAASVQDAMAAIEVLRSGFPFDPYEKLRRLLIAAQIVLEAGLPSSLAEGVSPALR